MQIQEKAPTQGSDDITATSGKTVSCIVIWQEGYNPKTIQPTTSRQRTVLKTKLSPFMQVIRFDTPQRAQNSGYDSEKRQTHTSLSSGTPRRSERSV